MISRRLFVAGSLCLCCAPARAAEVPCWTEGADAQRLIAAMPVAYSYSGPEIIYASGNRLLDLAFTHALKRMSEDFEVLPGFGYYDEHKYGDGANARAMAQSHPTLNRADGTIAFGLNLLKRLLARPAFPDAAIVAVAAHEFGHIVQYKRGIPQRLSLVQRHIELHADYLSGWFAGLRKLKNPDYPAQVFALTPREVRGTGTATSYTHGEPEERGRAVEAGFLASARDKLALNEAIEAGITYVQHGGFKPGTVVPYTSFR